MYKNVVCDIRQELRQFLVFVLTFHWLDLSHYVDREKIIQHSYLFFLVNTSTWSRFGCHHHRGNSMNIISRRLCSQKEMSAREVRRNKFIKGCFFQRKLESLLYLGGCFRLQRHGYNGKFLSLKKLHEVKL